MFCPGALAQNHAAQNADKIICFIFLFFDRAKVGLLCPQRPLRKASEKIQVFCSHHTNTIFSTFRHMEEQSFTLNNRFIVKPPLGVIRDAQSGHETRLEPRLMSLLYLLAANNEKVVARPVITKQIWDDYGNADEGLTQAISYLRKVLADDDKTLIETVPKKGYVLHAKVVYDELPAEDLRYVHSARRGKFMLMVAVVFILLAVGFFIFKSRQEQKQHSPDVIPGGGRPAVVDTGRKINNADKRPDTNKAAQPDAEKVK